MTSATCNGETSCVGGLCLPPTLLLFAGSGAGLTGGTYTTGGSWVTTALGDATSLGTSLTVDSSGRGVGVYTSTTDNDVGFTLWSGGSWGTATPITGNFAMGQPFLDATGSSTTFVTYQGTSGYDYWSLTLTSTGWSSPIPVGTAGNQNYGPVPATIAALGTSATLGFTDGTTVQDGAFTNWVASTDFADDAWNAEDDIVGPESYTVPPQIIPLTSGPELLMVFADQTTQMWFVTRTGGVWSTAVTLPTCLTDTRPALAPLPGGDAILAFQGTDSHLYWSEYSGGEWSTVSAFATPNVTLDAGTSPAVTHGIGTDVAELVYVSGGVPYYSSLTAVTWALPVAVPGLTGLVGVSIAATPGLTIGAVDGGAAAPSSAPSRPAWRNMVDMVRRAVED